MVPRFPFALAGRRLVSAACMALAALPCVPTGTYAESAPVSGSQAAASGAPDTAPDAATDQDSAGGRGPGVAAEAAQNGEVAASDAPAPNAPAAMILTDDEVIALIGQLRAPDFADRQKATLRLLSISSAQIPLLVEASLRHREAEVSSRALTVLGQIFAGSGDERVRAALEALEAATESTRFQFARSAHDLLQRHWRRRCDLTESDLTAMGVTFNPPRLSQYLNSQNDAADPARVFLGRRAVIMGMGQPLLQINVDQNWNGGARGIQLLKRLATIANIDSAPGVTRIGLYLIDGHPVADEQVADLRSAFGDARVVRRGRVCLGITNNPFASDAIGCRVGEVRPGTSADAAGILPEDLIISVNGAAIRDFEHLVELLRQYQVGDTVKMTIIREPGGLGRDLPLPVPENPADPPKPFRGRDIDVVLKGWE